VQEDKVAVWRHSVDEEACRGEVDAVVEVRETERAVPLQKGKRTQHERERRNPG
jgi:hypothetical protein